MAESSEFEVDPTTGKVAIGSTAWQDLRPIVANAAQTVGNMFGVIESAVGLPCDYVRLHLEDWRHKVRERFDAIPVDNRQLPQFRDACLIVREAAVCIDDFELQEMFARLLAAAADNRSSDKVHPSFASIISQLTPNDACILEVLKSHDGVLKTRDIIDAIGKEASSISTDSLLRLGLVSRLYFEAPGPTRFAIGGRRIDSLTLSTANIGGGGSSRTDEIATTRGVAEAIESLEQEFHHELEKARESQKPTGIFLTALGKDFVDICLPDTVDAVNATGDAC